MEISFWLLFRPRLMPPLRLRLHWPGDLHFSVSLREAEYSSTEAEALYISLFTFSFSGDHCCSVCAVTELIVPVKYSCWDVTSRLFFWPLLIWPYYYKWHEEIDTVDWPGILWWHYLVFSSWSYYHFSILIFIGIGSEAWLVWREDLFSISLRHRAVILLLMTTETSSIHYVRNISCAVFYYWTVLSSMHLITGTDHSKITVPLRYI